MYSMSTMSDKDKNKMFKAGVTKSIMEGKDVPVQDIAKLHAMRDAGMAQIDYLNQFTNPLLKSDGKKAIGSISPQKGVYEPTPWMGGFGYGARGVRDRFFNMSFRILRETAKRAAVISAIQNTRLMQIQPFTDIAPTDDDQGFRMRLKNLKGTPDKKDDKIMEEIAEFIKYSGYTNFEGAEERSEGIGDMMEQISRDSMTIDQVAITPRQNRKGDIIDYWILDGATIKRTLRGKGYEGDKEIKFVQEVQGRIVETFTEEEMIFEYMNRRTDIMSKGYGYSWIEMSLDMITAWLFAMAYNKEVFNSSSMPKGIVTFEGEGADQLDLEELQRQWISMFRGVKGMWKTPFLTHNAKWQSIRPSNQDMEFNQYTQVLASWVCAIHGMDPTELGLKFNQSQKSLYENPESRIHYSQDRGLKSLLRYNARVFNRIISLVDRWKDYLFTYSGFEAKDQKAELDVDEKQTQIYMTINEKRKEKDLKPIEGGDIINSQMFIQGKQQEQMAKQQEEMAKQGGEEEEGEFEEGEEEEGTEDRFGGEEEKEEKEYKPETYKSTKIMNKETDDAMLKSEKDYIELIF